MKTRAVILAGGEGSRLGTLTAKRTKPAVPFAGKYRIIDFTLSNCVNSGIFDVMILAQYRPHSLIEHIGAGGPWDLNRDFTGGVRIYSPYKARYDTDWYMGTADAVQQNFGFVKDHNPDLVLILSGDHIYEMNYDAMIAFHIDHQADLTMATIRVPMSEASRYGIVSYGEDYRVSSFIEKPPQPPSNMVNMGVYVFSTDVLDRELLQDHHDPSSSHDFGKDILPKMIADKARVFAYPYSGYWMDVGTIYSYWQAHMDLLAPKPSVDLSDRSWVIHTRTEERSPVRINRDAEIIDSLITDGCILEGGCQVEKSVLSPGVYIHKAARVSESILLTDAVIEEGAIVHRAIIDKRVRIGKHAQIGVASQDISIKITMIGKNSSVPANAVLEPGTMIGTDVHEEVIPSDLPTTTESVPNPRGNHGI
jgi:glucose-1-phosphate adenylyltransferase